MNHDARRIISRTLSVVIRIVVAKLQMKIQCLWQKVLILIATESLHLINASYEVLQEMMCIGLNAMMMINLVLVMIFTSAMRQS